jgi:hypothetical protein
MTVLIWCTSVKAKAREFLYQEMSFNMQARQTALAVRTRDRLAPGEPLMNQLDLQVVDRRGPCEELAPQTIGDATVKAQG